MTSQKFPIVVIGAGFGGLQAAQSLSQSGKDVLLIDRHNYHTFVPLLYQVATAQLEPEHIIYPARTIIRRARRRHFLLAEVEQIDFAAQIIKTDRAKIEYDFLVIATGSKSQYLGVPGAEACAFSMRSIVQAVTLRNQILECFETASIESNLFRRQQLLTFVIIVIFLLVFFGALFDPTATAARQTLIPKFARLAGISLTRVNGYRDSLENGADLLGPILGAVSIGSIGIINTFFANTVSFFICAMVFAIAVPRQHHRVCQSEEKVDPIAGIRFIFQHSQLRSLAVSSMALNFVLLPFLGLLLPILTIQKFASTALLGICLSLFGMAATIGALSFSNLARLIERSTIYYGGLILIAIAIILCGVVETPTGIMFSVTIGGLLLGAGNPLEQTILQEVTPSRIAGQVFTVHTAMSFAVGLIGLPIAGIFTELTNIDLVLIISGSFLAIGSTICWYLMPLSNRRLG